MAGCARRERVRLVVAAGLSSAGPPASTRGCGPPRVPGNPTVRLQRPAACLAGGVGASPLFNPESRLAWLVFSSGRPWYRGGIRGWAGQSGRLDVVARLAAAVCREGVTLYASLRGPALLRLDCPGRLTDELDAGEAILGAMRGGGLTPGIDARELVAEALAAGWRLLLPAEDCRLDWSPAPPRTLVVIGGDVDPPGWVRGVAHECRSLGPRSYLASVAAALLLSVSESLD